jgi:hypothetical protein
MSTHQDDPTYNRLAALAEKYFGSELWQTYAAQLERDYPDTADRSARLRFTVEQYESMYPQKVEQAPRPPTTNGLLVVPKFDIGRYLRHERGGQIGERMGMYVAVPRMLNYIKLPLPGRELYRVFCAFANNETDLAQVSYDRLALEAGMSRQSAVTWAQKLAKEYGLIRIERRSRDRVHPNTYRVLYPKDWPVRYRGQLVAALTRIHASGTDDQEETEEKAG